MTKTVRVTFQTARGSYRGGIVRIAGTDGVEGHEVEEFAFRAIETAGDADKAKGTLMAFDDEGRVVASEFIDERGDGVQHRPVCVRGARGDLMNEQTWAQKVDSLEEQVDTRLFLIANAHQTPSALKGRANGTMGLNGTECDPLYKRAEILDQIENELANRGIEV